MHIPERARSSNGHWLQQDHLPMDASSSETSIGYCRGRKGRKKEKIEICARFLVMNPDHAYRDDGKVGEAQRI
jgi:hypothetical protein